MNLAMEDFREGDSVLFMPARTAKGETIWVAFTRGLHEGVGVPVPYYLKHNHNNEEQSPKPKDTGYKMGRVKCVEERTEGGSAYGIKEGRKFCLVDCDLI